jgi:hypothetical protein
VQNKCSLEILSMPRVSKKSTDSTPAVKVQPVEVKHFVVEEKVESVAPAETARVFEPELRPFATTAAEPLHSEGPLEAKATESVVKTPKISHTESGGKGFAKAILFFVLGFVVGGGVIGGGIYYKLKMDKIDSGSTENPKEETLPTAAPSATSTPVPSASTSAQIKLSSYKVEALNGSGISGKATQVKGMLEKAGFADVKVGNADKSNYTDTSVAIKLSVSSKVFDTIVSVLSKNYNIVKAEDPLDEKADFDVVITVGTPK